MICVFSNRIYGILLVAFLSSFALFSQDEGEVVISEERLQELANKLYELKKSRSGLSESKKNAARTRNYDEKSDQSITYKSSSLEKSSKSASVERLEMKIQTLQENLNQTDFSSQFEELQQSIANLDSSIKSNQQTISTEKISEEILKSITVNVQQAAPNNKTNTIIQTKQGQTDTTYYAKLLNRIDSLENNLTKKDSIYGLKSQNDLAKNKDLEGSKPSRDIESLKTQINLLETKIDRLIAAKSEEKTSSATPETQTKKPVETEEEKSEYEQLAERFSDYKTQFFFDNNSSELQKEADTLVTEIANTLRENIYLDVYIKGFASASGSPEYNKKISMQRAESLKTALIDKGIHPTRILTHYFGIDSSQKEPKKARRLDVNFIVRR
ncbi:MAG: OmpA family protein [Bacteroidota bacterium]